MGGSHLSDSSLLGILFIVNFVTLILCFRQCIAIACVNSFSSLYAGVVVFSTLGFMAKQQGVSVGEVAESGKRTGYLFPDFEQTRKPGGELC